MTGCTYLEEFLAYLRVERQMSPHTLRNYRLDLTQFSEFYSGRREGLALAQVTYQDLRAFLATALKRNRKTTVARKLSALRTYLNIYSARGSSPEPGETGPQSQAGKGPAPLPERGRGLSPAQRAPGR